MIDRILHSVAHNEECNFICVAMQYVFDTALVILLSHSQYIAVMIYRNAIAAKQFGLAWYIRTIAVLTFWYHDGSGPYILHGSILRYWKSGFGETLDILW